MLPSLIPQEDADASSELAKQFRKRGITLQLGLHCTNVEDSGSRAHRPFRRRPERRGGPDARLHRPRASWFEGLGLERAGVEFDRRTGIATDARRRTSVPHIYAVGDCAGYWQLAHTAFREGEVAAQNACGHDATVGHRAVPRPIYTDPEIASVGLTEAQARTQHGDDVATGTFPWIANARAVMQNETAGWVKSIHTTRGGETARPGDDRPARDRHDRGRRRRDRLRSSGRDRRRRHGAAPDPIGGHQGRRSRRARPGDRRPEPESGPATRIHDKYNLSLQQT